MWSDNAEPVDMVRLVNPNPLHLPGVLRFIGPVRIDQFIGRLEDHTYIPRPFIYAEKISVKPVPSLELGFSRTTILEEKAACHLLRGIFRQLPRAEDHRFHSGRRARGHGLDILRAEAAELRGVLRRLVCGRRSFPCGESAPAARTDPALYVTRFPKALKLDLLVGSGVQRISWDGRRNG